MANGTAWRWFIFAWDKTMTAAESTLVERMPVWTAMSALFLDTELQEEDHQRIANVLAASPYSEKKLDEILRFEVTPVLKWNLMSVAGEWASFDEAWLRERQEPRIDARPLFRPRVFWMMRRRWAHIMWLVASGERKSVVFDVFNDSTMPHLLHRTLQSKKDGSPASAGGGPCFCT